MKRILPGDLVTFVADVAEVSLVQSERKTRKYDKRTPDLSFTNDSQKNRLAELYEAQAVVSSNMSYLVLAASEKRAFLLKSDSLQYLVALTDDLHVLGVPE